uniref:Uncharacterized protein n=1 Tax=Strigamia maritima TaxID=126957 RepID=T1IWC2_STRMM
MFVDLDASTLTQVANLALMSNYMFPSIWKNMTSYDRRFTRPKEFLLSDLLVFEIHFRKRNCILRVLFPKQCSSLNQKMERKDNPLHDTSQIQGRLVDFVMVSAIYESAFCLKTRLQVILQEIKKTNLEMFSLANEALKYPLLMLLLSSPLFLQLRVPNQSEITLILVSLYDKFPVQQVNVDIISIENDMRLQIKYSMKLNSGNFNFVLKV